MKNEINRFLLEEKRSQRDFLRPQYHFSAPRGWINDPNGLIYADGWYHLFYQHNPDHLEWATMYWGHAVSRDLLHWQDLPIALSPDQPYDNHPEGGCWSGSAVEKDGRLYLFYTGSVKKEGEYVQTQNVAYSDDGVHFTKYEGNPVVSAPAEGMPSQFRDPKVFAANGAWYMVVGGAYESEGESHGCVFLYRSEDLLHWDYRGTLIKGGEDAGTMMECPDFFPLGEKWVLTGAPMNHPRGNQCLYMVGTMDFDACQYTVERSGRQDYGKDWYATQSFLDENGNRVMIPWQGSWQWMPWFDGWTQTEGEGWRNPMGLPHIATLSERGELSTRPISLNALAESTVTLENVKLAAEPLELLPEDPFCYELRLALRREKCPSGCVEVALYADEERCARLTLDLLKDVAVLDLHGLGSGVVCAPLPHDGPVEICVQADHCSLEVVINESVHMTQNVYPTAAQKGLMVRVPWREAEITAVRLMNLRGGWKIR